MLPKYGFDLRFFVLSALTFAFAVFCVLAFAAILLEIKTIGVKCDDYTFSAPIEEFNVDFEFLDEIEPVEGN